MLKKMIRTALVVVFVALLAAATARIARAGHGYVSHGQDLFYNYYHPGYPHGAPAQLYLAPRPTPPLVGHTYITYQPLMPHEFLYKHHRTYHRYHAGKPGYHGYTRTMVLWK